MGLDIDCYNHYKTKMQSILQNDNHNDTCHNALCTTAFEMINRGKIVRRIAYLCDSDKVQNMVHWCRIEDTVGPWGTCIDDDYYS